MQYTTDAIYSDVLTVCGDRIMVTQRGTYVCGPSNLSATPHAPSHPMRALLLLRPCTDSLLPKHTQHLSLIHI